MKTKIIPILLACTLSALFFYSCEDGTYKEYTGNAPVYLSYTDFRAAVTVGENSSLRNPGKIYFKDNYIFIIEELEGIHVFDNTDPSAPVNKSFIKVPGAVDMAISGNIMYTDSYIDLVVLDLQNIDDIKEVGRVKDIIPYTVPPTGNNYPIGYVDQEKGVVINWELKTIREKVHNYQNPSPYPLYKTGAEFDRMTSASGSNSGVSGGGVGIGGSMARFAIKGNVLYLLGANSLKIYNIGVKTEPVKFNEMSTGSNAETIFLTEKNMFLGTTTGMVIYDISNPLAPANRVFFNHARSCDPVIVDDTLAYVTLRSGTNCGGSVNCLDVVNIKDLLHPSQVISYPMTNPHGLGKSGNILFVCDGSAGLKVFNASFPKLIFNNILYTYPGINAFDVIPVGNVLVMIGDDGLYQYDYSNILNITLLSKIEVIPE